MNGGSRPSVISRPFTQTARRADDERQRDRHRRRHRRLERERQHDAGQRQHRADRQIDPAGDDHERHPHGDDGVERGLLQDVEQVRDRQEVRRRRPQDRAQRQQAGERAQLPAAVRRARAWRREPGEALATPAVVMRALRAPPAGPRRRWPLGGELAAHAAAAHHEDAIAHAQHLRQIRRNHDDAGAVLDQLVHEQVDVLPRGHVDAARRLVEDQDVGVRRQPLRQHDLLLIAAAQVEHELIGSRRADPQARDRRIGLAAFLRAH